MRSLRAALLLFVVGSAACKSSPHVTVAFAATVNAMPFSCTQTYTGIGTTHATITPQDLRLYVSNVMLTSAHGSKALVLDEDSYQDEKAGIALLDFEDGTGTCTTGSPTTHTSITGTASSEDFTGITFTLGVPQALDHVVDVDAVPPLDEPAMFQAGVGYKYLKADVGTQANPSWMFHLAADTCSAESDSSLVCKDPNLADIALAGWSEDKTITFDLGALFAASDLDATPVAPDTVAGCISTDGDPECPPLFGQLGMTFEGQGTAGTQKVFTLP